VLDFVASDTRLASARVEVIASGNAALPALHALLFDSKVARLELHDAPASYAAFLREPVRRNWYSCTVPGILERYDIPDLIRLVGQQRISIVND
jgi:hypothetical protein